MSALSDEFARLADAATPGPWTVVTDFPQYAIASTSESSRVVSTPNQNGQRYSKVGEPHDTGISYEPDAEFIAFCGTHRAEIERKLRIADVVLGRTKAEALRILDAYCSPFRRMPEENVESTCRAIIAVADERKL